MSTSFEINAQIRDDKGKGSSRRLRREGNIPAVIYGADEEATSLSLSHNQIFHMLENDAFYSSIIDINMGEKTEQAILKDVQRHPFKPTILHMDFLRIKAGQPIHTNVPLHFINEDKCVGVKAGGIIQHLKNDVEIIVLPRNLPEFIEVDTSKLEIGDSLHLTDLDLGDDIELVALTHGEETDKTIVAVQAPKLVSEDEDTGAPEEPGEVPVAGEEDAEAEDKE